VDAELAFAGTERLLGGAVRARADAAGLAHQLQFVWRLVAAIPVQIVEHGRRIICLDPVHRRVTGGNHGVPAARQLCDRVGGSSHDADVEGIDPVTGRHVRYHVPVIARLQEDKLRFAARRVDNPAARRVGQRQPVLEVRAGDEWLILVVEKFAQRHARGDQQMVEAGQRKRLVRAVAQRAEVIGIKRGKAGRGHGHSCR